MKKNIKYTIGLLFLAGVTMSSCDSYLDKMPDNRTDIDNEDKIVKLITSAYPVSDYLLLNEYMSDNVDDMGPRFANYTDRFTDEVYSWEDVTERDNEGPEKLWQSLYTAIASANQALESIEKIGGPTTRTLKEAKGEALMCRAFAHFILTNEFCMNYNSATSKTDLGVPYMTSPETTLFPKYERGTVAEDYELIEKDIEEALPLIGDSHLTVPKYHFNAQAAYAFAARFYLYYEKWDKSVDCANVCLGSTPSTMLRDWSAMNKLGITDDLTPRTNSYIDATSNSNLLLLTSYSTAGIWGGNYSYRSKYCHNSYISANEDLEASNIYGAATMLRCRPLVFKGNGIDRVLQAKLPYLFEIADEVSQTGYNRTVYPAFKTDLTLLERAEAYTMLKQYDKACADLNLWMKNYTTTSVTITPENVTEFFNGIEYATWNASTLKKHLNPAFAIDAEGSTQECLLQCALSFKKIEMVHEGYRWFDIKRYGINIVRRLMNAKGEPERMTDSLATNDLRRAIQIPLKVRQAGLEENPR